MIKKVSEVYPELVHYTNAAGLKGILESQSLWACHSQFLNDAQEIDYFFKVRCETLITEALHEALRSGEIYYKNCPASENLNAALEDAINEAKNLTDTIRTTTRIFNQPYLLSFCCNNESQIVTDGLLSQWRAYGGDGGYALVFDSEQLENLLEVEAKQYFYQHMQIGNVCYFHDSDNSSNAEPEIIDAEKQLRNGVVGYYKDPKPENLEKFYVSVTTLSCFYKHWGFHEEHEVRVVAIPANEALIKESTKQGVHEKCRDVNSFFRDGCLVPYIALFSLQKDTEPQKKLPIKKIIIGPHRDSERRRDSIEHMLKIYGLEFPISVSSIPFIGRVT